MPLRRCLIAGFVLLWTSVLVIPLGAHLKTQSPRFEEFERQFYAKIITANPVINNGPNMYWLAFSWLFVGSMCLFIGLLFTGGVFMIRGLLVRKREIGLLLTGVFTLGCLAGAILGLGEAAESFHWGFTVLGVGYLLSAAGLGLSSIGVIGSSLSSRGI